MNKNGDLNLGICALLTVWKAVTLPIRPPQAPFSLIRRENSEFSSFHRATVSAESPSTPENLTREQGAAIRPRLGKLAHESWLHLLNLVLANLSTDATEQALTGFEIVPATSRSGPSRAGGKSPETSLHFLQTHSLISSSYSTTLELLHVSPDF